MQNTTQISQTPQVILPKDRVKFATHLPQSKKEQALFFLIVSVISVNLIAPAITFSEIGPSLDHYRALLPSLLFIWVAVAVVFHLVEVPAAKLTQKIAAPTDSFRTTMIIGLLCNVLMMSVAMTIIGSMIGTHNISLAPFMHFFEKWPRNFMIALIVEGFIAQPLARQVLAKIHTRKNYWQDCQ